MIAFRVTINDEPSVVGGSDELSVLTAVVTATGKLGKDTFLSRTDMGSPSIDFRLGGLTRRNVGVENEHLDWLDRFDLKPGDKVVIEIVETANADAPISIKDTDATVDDERVIFEMSKKNYLALKSKYEPQG